jgi:hypothetical protein
VRVTFCDKAEKTRLVRVGIGGANNVGETEVLDNTCVDNGKPMGCTFSNVTPGAYRIQDGLSSALVYAGPAPSPAGDVVVELACQAECVHTLKITADPLCGGAQAAPEAPAPNPATPDAAAAAPLTGTVRVYTAEPAPIASTIGEYPWTAGTDVKIGPMMCSKLVAEVDVPGCATQIFQLQPREAKNVHTLAVAPVRTVDLKVSGPDGARIANAYVSDDALRTTHTDATGALKLARRKDAPSSIWVQATGFAGGLFAVPAEGPMSVTLSPAHEVSVTCVQGSAPCAGPIVVVGTGVNERACAAKTSSSWTCLAADGEAVWARQGSATSQRQPVAGQKELQVTM